MITNMIVLLCLSALFPVLMGTDVVKSGFSPTTDCSNVNVHKSGVYTITTIDGPVQVYCDVVTGKQNDQAQWTVILRRMDGSVNFFRPWESYKKGFGNKEGEYWLGIENIHQLTRRNGYKLRVDLEDFEGLKSFAEYQTFYVGSQADGYKLYVNGFVDGGAGDSLGQQNGMKFSTFDRNQDPSNENCAKKYFLGGFWYFSSKNGCYYTNPTGLYLWAKDHDGSFNIGTTWKTWKNNWNSLKSITMKIRRVM